MRLFKNLRKQLIGGEKSRKYMAYAIGEILLLVIGILIALQINNWNENRQNRNKEVILLSQLRQEFSANLDQLNDKIDQRKNIVKSAKTLLVNFDQGDINNSDSIVYHLQRTVFIPTFNTNSSDFFSARDISLIQNDSLRVLLAAWPSQVDQLVEEELQWVTYRDKQYLPFLTSHFQARNLYNGVQLDLEMMRTVLMDKSEIFNDRIGNSREKIDLSDLMTSQDFEDHLGFAIMVHNLSNIQSYTLVSHIEKILEQIKH